MKSIAIHDRHGTIVALISFSPDAPPPWMAPGPGQTLAEVEVLDGALDIPRLATEQRVAEVLREFQVEFRTEAKLVRRRS